MSDAADRSEQKKKPMGGELIIPIAALLFTAYYFWTIIDVPWTAQVSAFFVGTILTVLIVIFVIRTVASVRRGEADFRIGPLIEPGNYIVKRLVLLALTVGFIVFVQYLGFTITAFLFLFSAMLLLSNGRRIGLILALSATLAIAGWALFIWAFHTRFPAGPFEIMMQGIV